MTADQIFNKLKDGIKDLVDSYIANPTNESKDAIEGYLRSLEVIAHQLGVSIGHADMTQLQDQINAIMQQITKMMEQSPTVKTFIMIDSLMKVIRKL